MSKIKVPASLSSIGSGDLEVSFQRELRKIVLSYDDDNPVDGKRKIRIDIEFDLIEDSNIVGIRHKTTASIPTQSYSLTGQIEDGLIEVDVDSKDIQQHGLPLKMTADTGG